MPGEKRSRPTRPADSGGKRRLRWWSERTPFTASTKRSLASTSSTVLLRAGASGGSRARIRSSSPIHRSESVRIATSWSRERGASRRRRAARTRLERTEGWVHAAFGWEAPTSAATARVKCASGVLWALIRATRSAEGSRPAVDLHLGLAQQRGQCERVPGERGPVGPVEGGRFGREPEPEGGRVGGRGREPGEGAPEAVDVREEPGVLGGESGEPLRREAPAAERGGRSVVHGVVRGGSGRRGPGAGRPPRAPPRGTPRRDPPPAPPPSRPQRTTPRRRRGGRRRPPRPPARAGRARAAAPPAGASGGDRRGGGGGRPAAGGKEVGRDLEP